MDEFEKEEGVLRRELRHVHAPDGFTERVMRQVEEREASRTAPAGLKRQTSGSVVGEYRRAAWWTAAAAAVALAVGGGELLHVRHQRQAQEAAMAQAQVDLAMQVTSHALNEVRIGFHRSSGGRFTGLFNETER